MASKKKPTIVLVPGAYHLISHYSLFVHTLVSRGYSVLAVELPSNGFGSAGRTRYEDILAVYNSISEACDNGDDVLLVMHSLGGIAGCEGAEGLAKVQREAVGLKGGILRLVFITALLLDRDTPVRPDDQNISWKLRKGPFWTVDKTAARKLFYNDLPEELAQACVETMVPMSAVAQSVPRCPTYEAWRHIPYTYVICEKDNCLLPDEQEEFCRMGSDYTVERLQSGHSPFLSMPERLADVIDSVARHCDHVGKNLS